MTFKILATDPAKKKNTDPDHKETDKIKDKSNGNDADNKNLIEQTEPVHHDKELEQTLGLDDDSLEKDDESPIN